MFMLGFVTEDILWPPLFSLPPRCRLPSVLGSDLSMPTDPWAVLGGCQHGRLWAQPEKPHQSKDSPCSLPENHMRGPCTAPLLSSSPFPPSCASRLEQASGARLPLDGFASSVVSQQFDASQRGGHWRPALCLAGHSTKCGEVLKSTAPRLSPTQVPHLGFGFPRVTTLQTPRATDTTTTAPLHPQAGDAAAELGSFLHGPEAEDSLQTKDLLYPSCPLP